jgi:hypothetical protein
MYEGFDDIEDLLIRVIDNYDGYRNERWSGTIYHEQAKRFAEAAIEIAMQLVAGESIDYEMRVLEDEVRKPDFYEALRDPALFKMFEEIITKTPQNLKYEKIKEFGEDFTRTDPRDKESPLRLTWERISIDLAYKVIGKICLGADRVLELFRMVLKTRPSEPTQKFLGRLARCYIWGFEPECVILCRSVLDTAFNNDAVDVDVCEKHRGKRKNNEFTLKDRIIAAAEEGIIDDRMKKLAIDINKRGNLAVHCRPGYTKDVFGTICDTLTVLEQLQKKRRNL